MSSGLRTLLLYLAAGAIYITIAVFFPNTILSWVEGATFLLIAVGVVPTIFRRWRR